MQPLDMSHDDQIRRFVLENTNVRGQLVHMGASWRTVCATHDYPDPVRRLLGESLSAAMLMGSTLKFKGSLTMQAQSEGPVTLLVAQITAGRTLRGLARWRDPVRPGPLQTMLTNGRIVITIEPGAGRERFQSIVDLAGQSLSDALDHYFERSEQLPTRLWVAADHRHAAGLLLQALPLMDGERMRDEDAWDRAVTLGSTITSSELLELPAEDLLRRLYHQETVRLFDPQPVMFHCTCSRERIASALRSLGPEEMRETLAEQGRVETTCEFCNQRYEFDAVDIAALFTAGPVAGISESRH